VTALENSRLFNGLSPTETARLKAVAQARSYPPGAVIFEEGEEGDGVYVIESGSVAIIALVSNGERRTLATLGAGEFFGEMAVLDNEPRSASAETREPTTAWFIARNDLLSLLDKSPKMAVQLVREFSLKMREFNRRYIEEVLQAERLALVGRFARSIVHDFKNPLNVIGLAADMVAIDGGGSPSKSTAAGRIRKQVDRLGNMINELLEFTRGGHSTRMVSAVPVRSYIRQLVEDLKAELAIKGVELVIEGQVPDVLLMMDPQRVTHLFHNLCHNAVEAMPDGGKILLRLKPVGHELVIELEDTGTGIAPEIAPRLFEAFATHGKANGTGLGLSICKRIVEDHRGWIRAMSIPGRGAIFVFALPLAATTPAAVGQ